MVNQRGYPINKIRFQWCFQLFSYVFGFPGQFDIKNSGLLDYVAFLEVDSLGTHAAKKVRVEMLGAVMGKQWMVCHWLHFTKRNPSRMEV